ncbi:MATE family efflux transporter [Clostridioides sp. ES-S-0005-03]|uniref:MATE family efflux transporter n=1 Tax=Clostridioides sp. ES-S-0005-03 TaxID=2770774 RepID=UPI001D112908|nr:MATE family efflux transporter [Clostridioides sp. ES-S-0005-03]UDN47979.1 MATE family efflux transporter [Clostridioides sp. ES-S-0173-01]
MKYTTNLTEGYIKKELVILMFPLLLGNILQQLYNTIDAIIVGRFVSQTAFAAVGVAGTIMNLFIFVLSGSCTGISIIFAHFYGASDLSSFRKESFLATIFGITLTLGLSICSIFILSPLLNLIHTPQEVSNIAIPYLNIIFCGLIATYFYNLLSAALRAVGNTKATLIILMLSMIINTVLDIVFVAVCDFGIQGAASATVLSQTLASILCFIYIRKNISFLLFRKEDMKFEWKLLRLTLSYSLISALHQSSLYIGKLLVQGAVNLMGADIITAYTATTRIEGFANSFGDSGAEAISIFVAQNLGNENRKRAKQGFYTGLIILLCLGIGLSLIMYFSAKAGIKFMMNNANDRIMVNGIEYMKTIAIFYVLCFIGSAFVGWYRGSGKVNIPVIGTILHISIRVIISYLFIQQFALKTIAFATGIGWVSVVTFQYIIFCRSKK